MVLLGRCCRSRGPVAGECRWQPYKSIGAFGRILSFLCQNRGMPIRCLVQPQARRPLRCAGGLEGV
eukprot:4424646-Pyramimonas_sp.AAC.3